MLAWEFGYPDEHGMTRERYEQMLEQDAEPDVVLPELQLCNDRAYRSMLRYFSLAERNERGLLHLDYLALRDIMSDRGCTQTDRERVLDAWAALRRIDDKSLPGRQSAGTTEWEEKKRQFLQGR